MNTQAPEIDLVRLAGIKNLAPGSHSERDRRMCAMEAVAFIAREPWSDRPACASPVIGAFMREWNDGLSDDERDTLILPLIPRLVGTRSSESTENRRAAMAADWLVRVYAPAWLRLAGLTAQADALSATPEITDFAAKRSLLDLLERVRKVADAAGEPCMDAAVVVAWVAAGVAAWDIAWHATGVAAWVAAGAATGIVARTTAGDAARTKLESTRLEVQQSVLALVVRMIELKDVA